MAELLPVQDVMPLAADFLDADQSRFFQDLKMPRHGRPAAAEALDDLTRGHLASSSQKDDENAPARLMSQRGKDGVKFLQLGFRSALRHGDYLANMLNIVNAKDVLR